MALFKKKEKKQKSKPVPAAAPKPPKPQAPVIPPDSYTLLLGLAVLFFLTATVVLGLNYYWYQGLTAPAVLPLDWAK
ncbi:MAG: hypothetical protein LBT46_11130 [Planctomycetaceae bacterium]|jgi:hypothetical protein|nr:hypothetical protein [Planctomycetaceae bacterium]